MSTGNEDTIEMFRPVGPKELELLAASGFRRWPPRLPEQPFFYPVTSREYAAQIAEQWNVRDFGYGGVTRFLVKKRFADRYPVQKVGGDIHTEWWIPAEDLEELNDNIVGGIKLIQEFRD